MEQGMTFSDGSVHVVEPWAAAGADTAKEMEAARVRLRAAEGHQVDLSDQKGEPWPSTGTQTDSTLRAARSVSEFFALTPEQHAKEAWWRWQSFWKDGDPVDIETFVERYLGMYPSPGQREVLRALVGTDPYEWSTDYQQFNLAIGQGGGKNTYIIAPSTAYVAYKVSNMRDPWLYFSRFLPQPLDHGTKFEMPNSSMVTERQAKNVHFSKMKAVIRRCKIPENGQPGTRNWFETYAGLDTRKSFGDMLSKTITIPTQPGCGPIIMHSFDSTPTAPEGLHIIWAIVDEASRADTEAGYLDMDRLWNVYIGNLNTRFPRGVGKVINFSYLSTSEYDYTWKLHLEAEEEKRLNEKPIIYSVVKSTFEMNPNSSKDDASIQKAYRTDPTDAAARYEGIKGASREGFYQPHPEKVSECFFEIPSPIDYEFGITEREIENPKTQKNEIKKFVKVNLTRIDGDSRTRGWAFDAGVSGDAFILKGGYIETMNVMKDELFVHGGDKPELIVMNKRPIVDIVVVWQPQKGVIIDYLNVGEVLGALLDKFPNSRFAYSDQYNNEKFRQEIMAKGVACETLGFSNAQQMQLYTKLRWMFWNNIPQIGLDSKHSMTKGGLKKSVGEWNLLEHRKLLKINANKVDHPQGGSKDLADVDAILCTHLAQLEVIAQFSAGGLDSMTDDKKRKLAETLIRERRKAHIANVPRAKIMATVADAMKISLDDAEILNEYADEIYPWFRE
jgi:hypothetical protein